MNKPSDIWVSFPTAKALHDAGIVVDSYFRYAVFGTLERYEAILETEKYPTQWYPTAPTKIAVYPAPTAEELLKALPKTIYYDSLLFNMEITRYEFEPNEDSLILWYVYRPKNKIYMDVTGNKLCEMMAKMLIRLKEAGYELGK